MPSARVGQQRSPQQQLHSVRPSPALGNACLTAWQHMSAAVCTHCAAPRHVGSCGYIRLLQGVVFACLAAWYCFLEAWHAQLLSVQLQRGVIKLHWPKDDPQSEVCCSGQTAHASSDHCCQHLSLNALQLLPVTAEHLMSFVDALTVLPCCDTLLLGRHLLRACGNYGHADFTIFFLCHLACAQACTW